MLNDIDKTMLFCEYYKQWIEVYKRGAIREATMSKYLMTQKWVEKLAPQLKVSELTRTIVVCAVQIHSLDDTQYKRLMAYMKALKKLEQMESIVEK